MDDTTMQTPLGEVLRELDPRRVAALPDPAPLLGRLRERCPVAWSESFDGFWFVLLLVTFVTAGLDTTTNALSNISILLDQRPDLRRRLIEHPELLPSAIEEFLRYLTPLPSLARTATRDAVIGSGEHACPVAADQKVAVHWMAANHDPAEFDEPGEIRLDRSPNRHLAFGVGPHLCIGMHLARVELEAALTELLTRIPDYRVDHAGVARSPALTRQVHRLPLEFTPGPRLGARSGLDRSATPT